MKVGQCLLSKPQTIFFGTLLPHLKKLDVANNSMFELQMWYNMIILPLYASRLHAL